MKEFKYDVIQLLHSVRDRPCLWDKSLENYKDRIERRTAWEEIFNILDDTYVEMTPEEKRLTEEHIMNKWANIRDTFMKSLKTKMGRPKRKYLLHDHLKFLIQHEHEEESAEYSEEDVSVPFMKQESPEVETIIVKKRTKKDNEGYTPSKEENYTLRKRSKKDYNEDMPEKSYESHDLDFVAVDEANDPRIMNEDEAFFASLLPTVVNYSEDERLEFRIEVLNVMKRIKENRKWTQSE